MGEIDYMISYSGTLITIKNQFHVLAVGKKDLTAA